MQRILAAALFALFAFVIPAHAQSTSPVLLPGGCGTGSATNSLSYLTVDSTLKLCVNATVSASITGFPTTQSTGTPISVTTGGVTGTLPSGTVVVASNVGATNGAYCKLGASASTSDQLIPPNSWFSFTVGAATQLTCITSTSTTTVNMVGGTGLPTGSGGGGGGSSGGTSNITQVAGTAVNATVAATGAIPFDVVPGNNLAALVAAPINPNSQPTLAGGSTFVKGTTAAMTGTAATQILAAVATKVLYVTRIKCNNSSATATLVQITDGSGGTVLDTLAAGATFGGEQGTGSTPLFWTTAGNGLFAQDVTTSASVICTASGYSG